MADWQLLTCQVAENLCGASAEGAMPEMSKSPAAALDHEPR